MQDDKAIPSLAESVSEVLQAGLPGGVTPQREVLDFVISKAFEQLRTSPGSGILTVAAAWALTRLGEYQDALQLVGLEPRAGTPATLSAGARSAQEAIRAEVFLLNSHLAEAGLAAKAAADYAQTPIHKFRAYALLSATYALNGERMTAHRWEQAAQELDADSAWAASSWPALFARLQLHCQDGDAKAAWAVLYGRAVPPPQTPILRSMALLGSIWIHTLNGELQRAVTAADALTHGLEAQSYPPLFLSQAMASQALGLVHLGDLRSALALLADQTSPPGHAACFELQRAGAYLLIRNPREALNATERCISECPDHSLLSLPSVYLRRAVAHDSLGETELADAAFSRANHLAMESSGLRPALGLPLEILQRLFDRLTINEPDFALSLAAFLPPDLKYPDRANLSFVPEPLSDRERVLAPWIMTDLTLAAIADELSVSTNTIKTQTKSIYRKLSASTRQEAINRLGLIGVVPAQRRT